MRIVGEQLGHVGELFAVMVQHVVLAVALQAERHRQLNQQVLDVGAVRVVAVDAFVARGQRVVLHGGFKRRLLDLLMAVLAEGSGLFDQELGLHRVVRVMAVHATLLRGRMGVLACQDLLEVVVTAHAQIVDGALHRPGILGIIALVADAAIAGVVGRMVGDYLIAGRERRKPAVADLEHHRVRSGSRCSRRRAMLLLGIGGLSAAQHGGEQQQARNAKQLHGRVDLLANLQRQQTPGRGAVATGHELDVGFQAGIPSGRSRRESARIYCYRKIEKCSHRLQESKNTTTSPMLPKQERRNWRSRMNRVFQEYSNKS